MTAAGRFMGRAAAVACVLLALGVGNALAQGGTAGASPSDPTLEAIESLAREVRALRREIAVLRQAVERRPEPPSGTAPPPARALPDIDLDAGVPSTGESSAPVVMVEFSDYECPYCARFHADVFPRLRAHYIETGKLLYLARAHPLPFHRNARPAAVAADCAAEQGKFWEMNAALFANQRRLGAALYPQLASALALDDSAFRDCIEQTPASVVGDGESLGVTGTPTFFVGRNAGGRIIDVQRIVGAQGYSVFTRAIDRLLN